MHMVQNAEGTEEEMGKGFMFFLPDQSFLSPEELLSPVLRKKLMLKNFLEILVV